MPVDPILFMLFTAPLFRILTKKEKKAKMKIRGYVDDGLLTAKTSKEVTSIAKIQETFAKIEAWAIQTGMVFDQAKFEVIHFSGKKHFPNPDIVLLPVTTASVEKRPRIIKPVSKKRSMRWLGVYFDSCLSFSDDTAKTASKGWKAAAGLPMFVKTTRRVDAVIMRKVVHACILPILTHRTPAWWTGRTRTNCEGRTIQNSM